MILFICVSGALIVMIGRLGYIEVKSGERYEKIVLSNQEYSSTTIPFRRGDIVDRKGTVLATSTDVYNVILDCSVLTSKEEYLEPTMEALQACFEESELNYTFAEIREFISNWQTGFLIMRLSLLRLFREKMRKSRESGLKKNTFGNILTALWPAP